MKVFVTGLECSCTKIVSKIIADNLEIQNAEYYDGNRNIADDSHFVSHNSLPAGSGFNRVFKKPKSQNWDHIVIVTRDYNCSLLSKMKNDYNNEKTYHKEHIKGSKILKEIIKYDNSIVFSYESWQLIGDNYCEDWLKSLGISYKYKVSPIEVNGKYLNYLPVYEIDNTPHPCCITGAYSKE